MILLLFIVNCTVFDNKCWQCVQTKQCNYCDGQCINSTCSGGYNSENIDAKCAESLGEDAVYRNRIGSGLLILFVSIGVTVASYFWCRAKKPVSAYDKI